MKVTVKEIIMPYQIVFNDGSILTYHHSPECCEDHYLDFSQISIEDFEGLEFDLDGQTSFFERVEGYGIRLLPLNGHPVSIPGYSENNGYYSDELTLILRGADESYRQWDITECQSERY